MGELVGLVVWLVSKDGVPELVVDGPNGAAVGSTTICSSVVDAVSIKAVKVTVSVGLTDVDIDWESSVATWE